MSVGAPIVECMFDESLAESLPDGEVRLIVDHIGEARRCENQAAAQILIDVHSVFRIRLREHGECAQWAADTTDAVAGEISAALNISARLAADYVFHARCLHEDLPAVGAVFAAGDIDYATFKLVRFRTSLITDDEVLAAVDVAVAAGLGRWHRVSLGQLRSRVDRIVARHDRDAVRRRDRKRRDRVIEIWDSGDGLAEIRGFLCNIDAHLLEERLDALAATVCSNDLRTPAARRADAIGALAAGLDRLGCCCENPDCPGTDQPARSPVTIHVVAESATVEGAGAEPAVVIGTDWLIPAETLAQLARTATLAPIRLPADTAPECGYTPSRALADFVRCRDMSCRFPGCDRPATGCDLDHTIPYQAGGPTQASNLKSLCRKHHLLKTFWGWRDQQSNDGTVTWTAPSGQTYRTTPGSAESFPALCQPTGALSRADSQSRARSCSSDRTTAMPQRRTTRSQNRAATIDAERRLNRHHREADQRWQQQIDAITAIHDPPPF